MRGFFHALGTPFRVLMDPEGRRAWALMLAAGGGITMTTYAMVTLYLVRGIPRYAFQLGMFALFIIMVVLTGFLGLLIKRSFSGGIMGAHFQFSDDQVAQLGTAIGAATPPAPPPPAAPAPPVNVTIQAPPATPTPPPHRGDPDRPMEP